MTDKLTRIRLPNQRVWPGLSDWGEHTADAMINQARLISAHLRWQADIIDAATDDQFQIDIIRGPHVQKHVREVQKASETQP